ncbi:MAG: RNA polymerase sigma factor [Bacteroidales bacterium]|nr:RNA polymerase sigma factor [Bacteroidales bacterium]
MNNEDLSKIVSLCKEGNTEAQKKLFYLYSEQMMFVCKRYLFNDEDCKDVLMDSFMQVFKAMSSYEFKGGKALYSWIRTIVTNRCINVIKKKVRQKPTIDIEQYEQEKKIDQEKQYEYTQEELMWCLKNIPERLRLIFNMYVIDEYSLKDIAIRLETSVDTIKTSLFQARNLLRQKLEELKAKHIR